MERLAVQPPAEAPAEAGRLEALVERSRCAAEKNIKNVYNSL
jgi:hypothetical protein